jgi:hypothetical protein
VNQKKEKEEKKIQIGSSNSLGMPRVCHLKKSRPRLNIKSGVSQLEGGATELHESRDFMNEGNSSKSDPGQIRTKGASKERGNEKNESGVSIHTSYITIIISVHCRQSEGRIQVDASQNGRGA